MSTIETIDQIKQHYAQSLAIGLILSYCSGYIDAYTYVLRAHSLVAGQTGNIIFLAVDMADKGPTITETRLFTLIFFILGVFSISFIDKKFASSGYVKPLSLLPCIICCLAIGFLPLSAPNLFVVPPLAFSIGIMTTSFGKVEDIPYNNSFLTGNIKKGMIAWNGFFFSHNLSQKHTAILYFEITLAFTFGALCSALLIKVCGIYTIWLSALILTLVMLVYLYLLHLNHTHK